MSLPTIRTQLYINGRWTLPIRGETFENRNPANNSLICLNASATAEDVDAAVLAARACLNSPHWGYASTGAQRAVVLRKLGKIIEARKEDLATLDSLDMGKAFRESEADVNDAVAMCSHFADLAEKQDGHQGEVIDNGTGGDMKTTISLEPVGVIGAITPW